jgi:sec-independent protein translocase protein TatA
MRIRLQAILTRYGVEFHGFPLVGNDEKCFFNTERPNRTGVLNFFDNYLKRSVELHSSQRKTEVEKGIKMFGLQPIHLIFILLIALLIFGPSRFAAVGRSLGTTIKEFRSASKDAGESVDEEPRSDLS